MNVRSEIRRLRAGKGNVHSRELQRLAEAAGWTRKTGGKHIKYVKPGRLALPIPSHPGTMKPGIVGGILDHIEEVYDDEEG